MKISSSFVEIFYLLTQRVRVQDVDSCLHNISRRRNMSWRRVVYIGFLAYIKKNDSPIVHIAYPSPYSIISIMPRKTMERHLLHKTGGKEHHPTDTCLGWKAAVWKQKTTHNTCILFIGAEYVSYLKYRVNYLFCVGLKRFPSKLRGKYRLKIF